MRQLIIFAILTIRLFASGGYDNGTATGKGQFALDLTWNPLDLIEFGQTYAVLGYGLTSNFDFHAYYAHQTNDQNNYYYGLFYQFINLKSLDIATAVGQRRYTKSEEIDLFFPQFLFTIKLKNDIRIGGAFVNIKRNIGDKLKDTGTAFDLALSISLSKIIKVPKSIEDLRFTIGIFNPGVFDPDHGDFLPTYSVDILFKKFGRKN